MNIKQAFCKEYSIEGIKYPDVRSIAAKFKVNYTTAAYWVKKRKTPCHKVIREFIRRKE